MVWGAFGANFPTRAKSALHCSMSKQEIAPITGQLAPLSKLATRIDGWTLPKQAAFLRALSASHSVSVAARSVSMSRQSAYRLRSRLKGEAFDLAWEVAFHHSYDVLAHAALDRAINGIERPIFFQGEQVGSYRKYDERLTVAMLNRMTSRGNPKAGRLGPEAERHARDFEGLLGAVEAGEAVDTGAPQFEEPSEREHLENAEARYSGFAKEIEAHADRLEAEEYYADDGYWEEEEGELEGEDEEVQERAQEGGQDEEGDKQCANSPCHSALSHEQVLALLEEFDEQTAGLHKGDTV